MIKRIEACHSRRLKERIDDKSNAMNHLEDEIGEVDLYRKILLMIGEIKASLRRIDDIVDATVASVDIIAEAIKVNIGVAVGDKIIVMMSRGALM